MDVLWFLEHREAGPLMTFLTKREANGQLVDLLCDEPSLRGDVWIERFELVVAEPIR